MSKNASKTISSKIFNISLICVASLILCAVFSVLFYKANYSLRMDYNPMFPQEVLGAVKKQCSGAQPDDEDYIRVRNNVVYKGNEARVFWDDENGELRCFKVRFHKFRRSKPEVSEVSAQEFDYFGYPLVLTKETKDENGTIRLVPDRVYIYNSEKGSFEECPYEY